MVNGEVVASGAIDGTPALSVPIVFFNYIASFVTFENKGRMGALVAYGNEPWTSLEEYEEFVRNEWNEKMALTVFNDDMNDAEAGNMLSSAWRVASGEFDVVTDIINGKEHNVLQCISAGQVWFRLEDESVGNVGELEFYLKNNNAVGASYGGWTSSISGGLTGGNADMDGYFFGVDGEQAKGVLVTNGAIATTLSTGAAAALPLGSWRKYKLARDYDGTNSYYINDELVTAISGANPVVSTTHFGANYIMFSLQEGDKIALIKQQLGTTK